MGLQVVRFQRCGNMAYWKKTPGSIVFRYVGFTLVHYDKDSPQWVKFRLRIGGSSHALQGSLGGVFGGTFLLTLRCGAKLLKRGFNPSSISEVISNLKGSLALAGGEDVAYNEGGARGTAVLEAQPEVFRFQLFRPVRARRKSRHN